MESPKWIDDRHATVKKQPAKLGVSGTLSAKCESQESLLRPVRRLIDWNTLELVRYYRDNYSFLRKKHILELPLSRLDCCENDYHQIIVTKTWTHYTGGHEQ